MNASSKADLAGQLAEESAARAKKLPADRAVEVVALTSIALSLSVIADYYSLPRVINGHMGGAR
ncbi:hypothetical protein [Frankia sp. R82]|uniref:hypothetical protein n=1 Tax=Frankia sp. R82 TaxID=2950553 RepID=UPI0020432346|nr:hypothetical protein [Frankia sp. R82]MCM3884116.1 hypothetical protein [Frankia sp. R82]